MSGSDPHSSSGGAPTQTATSEELAFAGLAGQAEHLATGEVGAVELLEATLARIETAQPRLNGFRLLRPEAARAEAEAAA